MTDERVKARRFIYAFGLIFFLACTGMYLGNSTSVMGEYPGPSQFFVFMVWAYTLFVDNMSYRISGTSLAVSRTGELFPLAFGSLAVMCVFELLNLRLEAWYYTNCSPALLTRWAGLVLGWAAVLPFLFATTEFLLILSFVKKLPSKRFNPNQWLLAGIFSAGLAMAILALAAPKPYWPLGLAALFFLVEPVNYSLGLPSLLRELSWGRPGKTLALAVSGLFSGLVWNALNGFPGMRWVYTGQAGTGPVIFGLPLIAYPAFSFIAIELYSLYGLCSFVRGGKTWETGVWVMRGKPPEAYFRNAAIIAAILAVYAALSSVEVYVR